MSRAPGSRIGLELVGPCDETFELTDFLGQGSFGEVYQAVGHVSGSILAVKLLPVGGITDETRTALLNEMRLATQVVHPNVVQILYTDEGSSSSIGPYLIMEYVTGGTLHSILETIRTTNSKIALEEARKMMLDIARGAKAVNEHVVHRDIKPDNILYDGTLLKLGDFGISKLISERTRTHTFKGVGAIRYMAPEGWEYEKNTIKMDVYSVGLVFYEILTLKNPVEQSVSDRGDWKAWERAHRYSDCPDVRTMRTDVDVAIAQLLGRMVAKRPAERPEWEEVLKVLENQAPHGASSATVSAAVEAALKIIREKQKEELARAEAQERRNRKAQTYQYSLARVIGLFDSVVDSFNTSFQHGKIEKQQTGPAAYFTYKLPIGGEITIQFFPPPDNPIALRGTQLIGGGYITADNGFSANLMLVGVQDDEYGVWEACLFNFNAVMDVVAVIRKKGLSFDMKVPFGFGQSDQFYKEAYLTLSGGMHVFTAERRSDIKQFLEDVLETAFTHSKK